MERLLRTLHVDGHTVEVVEVIDEDGASYLVSINDVVVNSDAPLATEPSDRDLAGVVRRWAQAQ